MSPLLLAMAPPEREAFLAGVHVGVVAVRRGDGEPPAASPVWYSFEPGGDVVFVTGAGSEKAALLAAGLPVTFLVQDEAPPQRFVAVEGVALVSGGAEPDARRRIAERYLPSGAVDGFISMMPAEHLVTVRVRPNRWRSSDFGKLQVG